jgi:hypothetical protein
MTHNIMRDQSVVHKKFSHNTWITSEKNGDQWLRVTCTVLLLIYVYTNCLLNERHRVTILVLLREKKALKFQGWDVSPGRQGATSLNIRLLSNTSVRPSDLSQKSFLVATKSLFQVVMLAYMGLLCLSLWLFPQSVCLPHHISVLPVQSSSSPFKR